MSNPIIKVENLGKKYFIRHERKSRYSTIRDTISNSAKNILNKTLFKKSNTENEQEEFWALKDISFEVNQGDRIGIIGRNGAGKSTLLKILSRITEPTAGEITLRGRVASLLEVGTGFHPELSGRENIYLNGAILGMTRAEIRRKFDEIVDFAEVEKFLDTPVKHYSSGMYVRLAFAVAAHLESEILLIDEVLAVGDYEFQKKCLGKMEEVSQKQGRTVVFVSHNMESISSLTERGLVLFKGSCIYQGNIRDAIHHYLRSIEKTDKVYSAEETSDIPKIIRVEIKTSEPNNIQIHGKPLEIHIDLFAPCALENVTVSFQVINPMGQAHLHLWVIDSERKICKKKGIHHFVCHIPKTRLYLGQYTLTTFFSENFGTKHPQKIEGICPFEVVMFGHHREFSWQPDACVYIEDCEWKIT